MIYHEETKRGKHYWAISHDFGMLVVLKTKDGNKGAVWRVERKGVVDYLVKYVRPDKVDGLYLESMTGKGPVMNSF